MEKVKREMRRAAMPDPKVVEQLYDELMAEIKREKRATLKVVKRRNGFTVIEGGKK
jgi:hypothetical protein